jgi:hypothetical protein
MTQRACYACLAFVIASVLNPAYFAGCGSDAEGPHFQYGAQEMAEYALAANDSFDLSLHATSYRLDLEIEPTHDAVQHAQQPSAFAATAYACGDRKLVASAAACIDSSSMAVAGKFTLLRVADGASEVVASDVPVQGTLTIPSLILSGGWMDLKFDGGSIQLSRNNDKAFMLGAYSLESLLQ